MSESTRSAYRRFAAFFLVIGTVFLVLALLRATLLPDVLQGDPTPVALLLLAIGGGLRWTVRRRPDDPEPDAVREDDPLARDPRADVPSAEAERVDRG